LRLASSSLPILLCKTFKIILHRLYRQTLTYREIYKVIFVYDVVIVVIETNQLYEYWTILLNKSVRAALDRPGVRPVLFGRQLFRG